MNCFHRITKSNAFHSRPLPSLSVAGLPALSVLLPWSDPPTARPSNFFYPDTSSYPKPDYPQRIFVVDLLQNVAASPYHTSAIAWYFYIGNLRPRFSSTRKLGGVSFGHPTVFTKHYPVLDLGKKRLSRPCADLPISG